MKRIIALLLALVMCIGLFTGCGCARNDDEPAPTVPEEENVAQEDAVDENLEKALEYLRVFYKDTPEKTAMDYTRIGTVRVGGNTYEIVWSVDVGEDLIKIVANDDGSVTIDINEEAIADSTEPFPYVLTAALTGTDGREVTLSWDLVIPAAIDEEALAIVDAAYELAEGAALEGTYTLTGVIISVDTMYSQEYKNITVTIAVKGREDKPIQCYRLKGDGADMLAVGDTITVTGSIKNYYGTIEFDAGCILEAVESGGGVPPTAPDDPAEIVKQAYALKSGRSLPYSCKLTGPIIEVNQPYDEDYGNISVTITVAGRRIYCYRLKGSRVDELNVNDVITVEGTLSNYQGTVEFAYGELVGLTNKNPPARRIIPAGEPVDLATGDEVVIYVPGYAKALSKSKVNTYYNKGVDVYVDEAGKMTGYGSNSTWTVTKNIDGTYSFSNGGKNLSVDPSHSNMTMGGTHSKWQVIDLGGGLYNLKNVGRKTYIEWYDEMANFSTYASSYAATDDQFQISFYVVSKGEAVEATLEEAVAGMTELYASDSNETPKDYERLGVLDMNGTIFNVDWTVEGGDGAVVAAKNADGNYTIDITASTSEISYKLIAVITDAAGESATLSWDYVIPAKAAAAIVGQQMTAAPANGDVIIIVNGENAMTAAADGSRLASETASIDSGILDVTDTMAQLLVSVDENGYYTFTCGGKYLTSGATGNSLSLTDAASDYSLWTVEAAVDGTWYIKNVNAKFNGNAQSLEYYSGFTTYGHKDTAIYQMLLFKVTEQSGAIADGQYVIWNAESGKAMIALDETYNYGYMKTEDVTMGEEGLTGYTDVAVFTITNTEDDTVIITDSYGRVVYMTGTYNSFNVAAEAPETGAEWLIEEAGDGVWYIKNAEKEKYVSYDASYGSYGAYAEPGNNSVLTLTRVFGKDDAPEVPDEPDVPVVPDKPAIDGIVENPEAGVAYYMIMDKKDGNVLYFNGQTESESVTYRLATTTDETQAVPVYLENAEGGYHLYFMNGDTKTYIRVFHRTDGDPGYGKGSLEYVTTAPNEVYVFDEAADTLFYDYDGNNAYYMGTYSTYTTFSVSNTSYITGDKAAALDVSQFPARFVVAESDEEPDEPVVPDVPVVPEDPDTLTSGQYVLVIPDGVAMGALDGTWISAVDAANGTDGISAWTVTVSEDGATATLQDPNGVYVAPKGGNNNGIKAGEYSWSLVDNGDGTYSFYGQDADTVVLAYNSDPQYAKFRAYKTGTVSGSPEVYPSAFKLIKAGSGEVEPDVPVVPEEPVIPETLAEQIIEANALANGAYLAYESTITGTITDDPAESKYTIGSYKFTVSDGTNTLLCYYVPVTGSNPPAKGDTVTVTGKLTAYNGAAQFDETASATLAEKEEEEEDKPVVEGPYVMGYYQAQLGKPLYFSGKTSGYYLGTTEDVSAAAAVYTETMDKEVRLYFMDGQTKTYIETYLNGTYVNNQLVAESTMYYTWNEELGTYVADLNGTNYYLGTFDQRTDLRPSNISYITGDNAAKVGVSQYVVQLVKDAAELIPEGSGETEEPADPAEPVAPATLAEQIAEAGALANGAYLAYESTITGTITDDPVLSSYTDGAYKFIVEDANGNKIQCYYVPVNGGIPAKGDTITVTGKLTAFNGTVEFDDTAVATLAGASEAAEASVEVEESAEVEAPVEESKELIAEAPVAENPVEDVPAEETPAA